MGHCQLCYAILPSLPSGTKSVSFGYKKEAIMSSCNKYLSREIFLTINWNLPFDVDPFCEECGNSTQQLLLLDVRLEQVNKEIKQLISRITERVSTERQSHQLKNSENIYMPQTDSFLSQANDTTVASITHLTNFGSSDVPYSSECIYDSFEDTNENLPEKVLPPQKKGRSLGKKENIECSDDVAAKGSVTSTDLQLQSGSAFVCPNCNKKFTRLDILKRHECEGQTFECETCGKSFSSKGSLSLHYLIHSGQKPHKCEICGKGFSLPHHLRLHIKTHSKDKPYHCDICKKSFRDKDYLVKHKRQHSADESERRKYSCEICSKSFTLYQTLKHHLVRHTGDTSHKCSTCGKGFGTSTILRKHELIHTNEKNFKCTHCWKTFLSDYRLKSHMLTHTGIKCFQCDQCGSSFLSVSRLNMHVNMKHREDGEFVCDICGKLYKTQLQLNVHRRYHTRKIKKRETLNCVVCNRSYSDESNLVNHQKRAHIVSTKNSFVCSKCGKEFEDHQEFLFHHKVRLSKGDKFRFKCDSCNEIFPSRCDMICHFHENHTESEFPYKCLCGIAFVGRNELCRHKRECKVKPVKVKKIKGKRGRKRRINESNDSDDATNNCSRISEKHFSKSLRRSRRVIKGKMYAGKSEPKGSYDSFSKENESNSDHHSDEFSSEDSEYEVKVKRENEEWIKEEPKDISDWS